MSELYEVILEDVPSLNLFAVLNRLTKNGSIVSKCEIQGDVEYTPKIDWQNPDSLNEIINNKLPAGFVLFASLNLLNIDGMHLQNCGLRVIYYRKKFDIEVSFDPECSENLAAAKLSSYFYALCKEFDIASTFGGMEPASDKATRFFTEDQLGPIEL
ncbi:MAG: hypothetical protein ACOH5I_25325 [Oligoflexus sp.]